MISCHTWYLVSFMEMICSPGVHVIYVLVCDNVLFFVFARSRVLIPFMYQARSYEHNKD